MVEPGELSSPSESKTEPQKVGMLLEKLDDNLFEKVVRIYDKVFGANASKYLYPGYVATNIHEGLARINVFDDRFGSKFSEDSKIQVIDAGNGVVYFDFYVNTTRINPKDKVELERLESLFRNRTTRLLTKKGLAIPLK